MNDAPKASDPGKAEESRKPPKSGVDFIHRVCIQCNNVFRVPAAKFDAKQCPKCHKS